MVKSGLDNKDLDEDLRTGFLRAKSKILQMYTHGRATEEDAGPVQPVPLGKLIRWGDIIGAEREKADVERDFFTPILFQGMFTRGRTMLLYGPPGTGKTYIARGITSELTRLLGFEVALFAPSGADLKDKYVGGTEKQIRQWFHAAQDAAVAQSGTSSNAVSVLFIDEVEAIAGKRSDDKHMVSSVNSLLQFIDGATSAYDRVIVMVATNAPWDLDSAVLRRFTHKLLVDLPTDTARRAFIEAKIHRRLARKCGAAACRGLIDTLTEWSGASKVVDASEPGISTHLRHTGRNTRKGIVGALGYTLSDLDKVMDIAFNHIALDQLVQRGREDGCTYIHDPGCLNCEPCDTTHQERAQMRFRVPDIAASRARFKRAFAGFNSTVNLEEYKRYVHYHRDPGTFKS